MKIDIAEKEKNIELLIKDNINKNYISKKLWMTK